MPTGTYTSPPAPATRQISFLQLAQEADPTYQREKQQPWIYSFSNGRLFYATLPTYQFGTGT